MRFFITCTEELADVRGAAIEVAERVHREKRGGEPFETVDWSAYVAEQTGGGERGPLVSMKHGDVFLGLVWLRFGAPGAEDPELDGRAAASGTEEDFELAYRSSASSPNVSSFFFRCLRLPEKLADVHGDELARVERFFARFREGKSPGRFGEFHTAGDLEKTLEAYLGEAFAAKPPRGVRAVPAGREARPETLPQFARKMQQGKAYEVSFLALGMVGFADLARDHPDQLEAVETLHRSFKQLVVDTASAYGGEVFSWDAERGEGVLMFWSKKSYDHAIITGLKVLHSLPVFNLDPLQNPLGQNLEVKTAVHDAVIVFQLPIGDISSTDLEYLIELKERHTSPGEICVTKRLLERADARLKARFKGKGRFEREPVYCCRLPSTEQHTLRANLEEVIRRVKTHAAAIKSNLIQPTAKLELPIVDTISAGVDETYACLDRACKLLGTVDNAWSKKFFGELAGLVHVLVREEAELWNVLRHGHVQHRQAPETAARLEAVAQAASSLRSRPAVTLGQSEQGLRARASDEGEAHPPQVVDEEFHRKVQAFLRADPLDYETLLTDFLLNRKTSLVQYLTRGRMDKAHEAFRNRLWESADLLLLDDLYSIRGYQRANDTKLYDVLIHEPVADRRFQVVRQLLREEFRPSEDLVRQRFRQIGIEIDNRDLQTVWRAVVLGHPVVKIRTLAALKMSPFSMWQAIAHPSVPIASVHAIGERVAKSDSEDAKKIFFDCIRSRVVDAVETFRTRDELSAITKLILLLLDFPFLVETGYFERFDDILEKFLQRSGQLNLEVEYFVNLRKRLDSAKRDPDASKSNRPPAGITKLPLTIQRRLAGEKHYLFWFVSHPDPRVATETLRHVSLSNVERVLRSPEINAAVMAKLLHKPELFTRSGPLLAALNNPKCDLNFANRHLASLSRSRGGVDALGKLARNPSANPAVRSAATRLVELQKRQAGRRV